MLTLQNTSVLGSRANLVWTPDPTWNNLAWKCLAGMPRLLNSANLLFQISNVIGQVLLQFSKFLCSTVHSLPVINRTRTLVG